MNFISDSSIIKAPEIREKQYDTCKSRFLSSDLYKLKYGNNFEEDASKVCKKLDDSSSAKANNISQLRFSSKKTNF